jgi:general secretion pathway protein D
MKKDGKATAFKYRSNANRSQITLDLRRVGDVGGISGSGTLAVLTFKAKAKGVDTVRFKGAYVLSTEGSKPAEVNLPSKTIEIK